MSSLLGLICLFYFGIEVWNWNVNRNIAKTEGTIRLINQDLAVNAQRIDSIKNQPKKGNDLNVSSNLTNDNALKDLWQGLTENISGFKVDFETFKKEVEDKINVLPGPITSKIDHSLCPNIYTSRVNRLMSRLIFSTRYRFRSKMSPIISFFYHLF